MRKPTTEEFIDKLRKIHNNRYDYSKFSYITWELKSIIICSIHGEFKQSPNDHAQGYGCPECGGSRKLSNKEFIDRSNCVHNNKYDYSETKYINNASKVKIICKKHGLFSQRAGHHLKGHGCKFCKSSKGEEKIRTYLQKRKIFFEEQKWFKECKNIDPLPFDFYLPEKNILIEYDGEQHFRERSLYAKNGEFEKIKKRDEIKTNFAIENAIKIVRISYKEFDKVENILEKIIKGE